MSRRKTYLSRGFAEPFDFEGLTKEHRQHIEQTLSFIPGQRLVAVMERLGQDKFVHVSGRSWKQVSRYLKGDKAPTEVLNNVAVETGTSIDWLAQGVLRTAADLKYEIWLLEHEAGTRLQRLRTPKPEPEWSALGYGLKLIDDRLKQLEEFQPEAVSAAATATPAQLQRGQDDFVKLPTYREVRASAGSGATPTSQESDAIIAFDRKFLRDRGAVPERCSVIAARGDSMAPTIPDGSLLVVDHSQVQIANGYIMVISLGDDLLVKRIRRRLDGLIDMISDNQAYAAETIGPDRLQQLRVVGRVVYFCRVP